MKPTMLDRAAQVIELLLRECEQHDHEYEYRTNPQRTFEARRFIDEVIAAKKAPLPAVKKRKVK